MAPQPSSTEDSSAREAFCTSPGRALVSWYLPPGQREGRQGGGGLPVRGAAVSTKSKCLDMHGCRQQAAGVVFGLWEGAGDGGLPSRSHIEGSGRGQPSRQQQQREGGVERWRQGWRHPDPVDIAWLRALQQPWKRGVRWGQLL